MTTERTIYLKLDPLPPGSARGAAQSKILQFVFDLGVYAERTPFTVLRVEQVDWWVTAIIINADDNIAYLALRLKYGEMMIDFLQAENEIF
jgi:hypothetical protein